MKGEESIRIGTSAFTAAEWEGSFYPDGMKPARYLTFYVTRFEPVEVGSTFYRTPILTNGRVARSIPAFPIGSGSQNGSVTQISLVLFAHYTSS